MPKNLNKVEKKQKKNFSMEKKHDTDNVEKEKYNSVEHALANFLYIFCT